MGCWVLAKTSKGKIEEKDISPSKEQVILKKYDSQFEFLSSHERAIGYEINFGRSKKSNKTSGH